MPRATTCNSHSLSTMQVNGLGVPGLNLNLARFNVGGCSWNTIDNGTQRIAMVASPNIPSYKQIPGYWLDVSGVCRVCARSSLAR